MATTPQRPGSRRQNSTPSSSPNASDVDQGEVGGHGSEDLEAGAEEPVAQSVAPEGQLRRRPVEERIGQAEAHGHRRLEGGAVDVGQELLGGADGGHHRCRAADPADLPPGEGEGLPGAGDGQGPVSHAGQGRQGNVAPLEDQVLVDLVGDHQQVGLDTEPGDGGQLRGVEHLARRVVGGVEQQQAGAGGDGGGQLVDVEAPGRRPERHHPAGGTGHGHGGGVGVVGGLEHHHLVAGIAEGEHGGGDGLGGARRDQHLVVGVVPEAVEALLVGGDRPPEPEGAQPRGVLVLPAADGLDGGLGHHRGPVRIGVPLTEVDGSGPLGEGGHLGEDGDPEPPEPRRQHRAGAAGWPGRPAVARSGHRHSVRAGSSRTRLPQPPPGPTPCDVPAPPGRTVTVAKICLSRATCRRRLAPVPDGGAGLIVIH